MMMENFELMGKFYLGKEIDPATGKKSDTLVLYDSKDLTTHGMIIGMTGSGKTGLGMALLEEALMDNIPILAIDPKGDITNLLLSFPEQKGEDFLPWINREDATAEGLSVSDYALKEAEKWTKGLASWGINGARIRKMRESIDFTIYTPGSNAGVKVNMLGSFRCPSEKVRNDRDLFLEKVQSTTTTLLSLLNIESDPISGREHLLISKIFEESWQKGHDIDLPSIINGVQTPPFDHIGIMPTDTFYPPNERFKLALALNQILASPAFNQWMTGDPLDIGRFLHTATGKPRASIFTISHLSENERMFFVSMLLNEIVGWMRSQTGTPSLRAILYIDEVFGYMPPVKEPASKKPLLTLLKQARAFGIGVVLATQNPVDLDYKGLSNIGTWFIGRLQTQRDKDRVLEGMERLESISGFDREFLDKAITGLKKREFLLNNIHENSPSIFTSRWAMSYLRGPLSREQIKTLMGEWVPRPAALTEPGLKTLTAAEEALVRPAATPTEPAAPAISLASVKPAISPDIPEFFVDTATGRGSWAYKPFILGIGDIYYSSTSLEIDTHITYTLGAEAPGTFDPDWERGFDLDIAPEELRTTAADGIPFLELPKALAEPRNYTTWGKAFQRWIRQNKPLIIYKNQPLKIASLPEESEADFAIRINEALREKRDIEIEKLRKKYDSKMATLQKQLIAAEQAIERESEQAKHRNMETVISFGSAIASALFGRKSLTATSTYRMGSALSKAGRLKKEKMDVARAEERFYFLQNQMTDLEAQLNEEMDILTRGIEKYKEATRESLVRPKNTDINIKAFGLAWIPVRIGE
ncbi:MAG: DUF87 domain-containing protein [Aminobacterium sp.]|nr:DUF87 domain-containing protein [Aminobacterium sp.]